MSVKMDKLRLKKPPVGHALPNTPIYDMIRFWGRKPWNLVRAYIENYTKVGDVVLDPFGGCGVVAIESLKINRKAIYNDLNKYSKFIARTSAVPVNLSMLKQTFDKLLITLWTKCYP
ncbi:MAG: DNA adenine methylase, partial [Candidatus Aenigmarchaeota archaeon]|nr:DNA adenine methylase [Candidatus Aenigmarchaeota archaeon]